ncbi:MAG: dephospho-CoA kinase [Propionibacteriales bacterium]|nr:dephospho-CoA kinase [Propionibacteriales bacterium]
MITTTVVGLTGGIASGKSAVADLLADHGAVIIDADVLAREVVEPGTPGLAEVVARFGAGIAPGGRLDRAALGKIIFEDPVARKDLELIIHPAVRARAAELTRAAPSGSVVVQVIPLLVETGQSDAFDRVVVVDVDPDTQVRRLAERNGLDENQSRARIAAQASREDRLAAADDVIDNTRDRASLARQVALLWDTLES